MMAPIRPSMLAGLAWLSTPLALAAHQGHAGDHGWLAGAAEPLLSVDHFLAGMFVALAVALAVAGVARLTRRARSETSPLEP